MNSDDPALPSTSESTPRTPSPLSYPQRKFHYRSEDPLFTIQVGYDIFLRLHIRDMEFDSCQRRFADVIPRKSGRCRVHSPGRRPTLRRPSCDTPGTDDLGTLPSWPTSKRGKFLQGKYGIPIE